MKQELLPQKYGRFGLFLFNLLHENIKIFPSSTGYRWRSNHLLSQFSYKSVLVFGNKNNNCRVLWSCKEDTSAYILAFNFKRFLKKICCNYLSKRLCHPTWRTIFVIWLICLIPLRCFIANISLFGKANLIFATMLTQVANKCSTGWMFLKQLWTFPAGLPGLKRRSFKQLFHENEGRFFS